MSHLSLSPMGKFSDYSIVESCAYEQTHRLIVLSQSAHYALKSHPYLVKCLFFFVLFF